LNVHGPGLPWLVSGLAALLFLQAGCRPHTPPAPAAPADAHAGLAVDYTLEDHEFSVMTYNLLRYMRDDRDRDGQRDDPKPLEEREAVLDLIVSASPDVLAVQEMGDPEVYAGFKQALADRGLDYEFDELLRRKDDGWNAVHLAVLSRRPIVSYQSHLDDVYTMGPHTDIPVARGFIDVDIGVNPAYRFRLMVAHLKSKVFHEYGQTEMRRNEARLLNKHVRAALAENPRMNLLVVGDLNDTYDSRAVREVMGTQTRYLFDLRPRDFVGDTWTHFRASHDEYSRIDYALVSEGMRPEVVMEKTRVVRDPRTAIASDHRPIVAVFQARDLPAH
jgi:endonuclease/exonuclease/phosphatase family metal-dependent hydrolase